MPARLPLPSLVLCAALLSVVAACGPRTNEFPPACPNPIFLRDLSDIIRYRPGSTGRDLTDVVMRGRLTAIQGKCETASPTNLETTIVVNMELFRGPAMVGRRVVVPIFVAITEGEDIIDKRIFPVEFDFPDNVDRGLIATPPIVLGLPVSPRKSGAAYGLIVGFQLTPEELATSRRRGF